MVACKPWSSAGRRHRCSTLEEGAVGHGSDTSIHDSTKGEGLHKDGFGVRLGQKAPVDADQDVAGRIFSAC